LKGGYGFRHSGFEGGRAEDLGRLFHAADDMGQDLGDVRAEGVVEIVHAGQGACFPIGELDGVGTEDTALVHQHVLDDADRRSQADTAGGSGEGPDEFEQKIEVLRQERIKARERSRVGVALEQGRTGEAGVGDR